MIAAITGKQAWAIMAAGILCYELSCDEDELLSRVVDGWLITHPVLTRTVIATVALHLLNAIEPCDPLTMSFFAIGKVKEWCRSSGKRYLDTRGITKRPI